MRLGPTTLHRITSSQGRGDVDDATARRRNAPDKMESAHVRSASHRLLAGWNRSRLLDLFLPIVRLEQRAVVFGRLKANDLDINGRMSQQPRQTDVGDERRSYKDRAWIVNGSGRVVRRETIREAVMHELTPVAFEIA